jgi:hypothetical protein
VRFASVDFVNLPRIAMLTAGAPVMGAAARAGLDAAKPFRGQGAAPGHFVGLARPLFETWGAEAVVLDERTAGQVRRGTLVSFETSMRCVNPPGAPPEAPTGDLARDPHLRFRVGGYRVIVSFDPRWLTTTTAGGTLHDAVQDPQVYSGLGQVAAVFDDGRIRVSALAFGQPQNADQALFEYMMSTTLPLPNTLAVHDFRNELSAAEQAQQRIASSLKEENVERLGVVLFLDEDQVIAGEIDRVVLGQVVRVVPEYRRDLRVAVASLVPPDGVGARDVSAQLLLRETALWKTVTVPGLASLIRSCNVAVAVAVVDAVTREQAADLDEAMREDKAAYFGAVELDRTLAMQKLLFPEKGRYHMVGNELRLQYSAGSRYLAEANGEDLDEPLEEWLEEDLFRSVEWEEDEEQSAAEEYEATMIMEAWLRDQGRE